jgi:RecB family exonuclease
VSALSLPPEPILTFTPPTRFNVTGIRGLLRDPYRFVLENVLGLGAKDDEARELDALAFGSIAHEVLGRFGLSADRDSIDAALIVRRLDEYLDDAVTRKYVETFPAVWLQVEQLRVRLHAFAHWQAERAAKGWRIMVVEGAPVAGGADPGDAEENEASRRATDSRPSAVEIPFEVDDEPIQLRGRIDRIDHHPEMGWAIFDYKTGNSVEKPEATHLNKGEWVDAQLPLYRHLARAIRDADGEPLSLDGEIVSLGYIAIPREVHGVGERIAKWTDHDLAEADEAVRRAVRAIRHGSVAFTGNSATSGWADAFDALLGNRLLSSADDEGAGTDTGAMESGE